MEQCRGAMIAEGASTLQGRDRPPLRFLLEAKAASFVKRPPEGELVWTIIENGPALHQTLLTGA